MEVDAAPSLFEIEQEIKFKEQMRGEGRIEEYRKIMGHSGACSSNDSKVIPEEDIEESLSFSHEAQKDSASQPD
jgi:hypothetical protein